MAEIARRLSCGASAIAVAAKRKIPWTDNNCGNCELCPPRMLRVV
jgi:hypothetical protein